MFSMASSGALSSDPQSVLETALARLKGPPSLIVGGVASDAPRERMLAGLAPGIAFHGSTSCSGVMTEAGTFTEGSGGSGFLAISDPEGDYGSAIAPILAGDAQAAAATALIEALRRAGRPGEAPDLVWLTATPGQEEQVIEGLQGVIGLGVPICGGTAADNEVAGNWLVFNQDGAHGEAVAVTVMFPSVPLGYAFHSGYQPTQTKGVVTRAEGRSILEIDGKPGAAVYNDWTDGVVGHAIDAGGNVLFDTTHNPLGRRRDAIAGFDYFLLSHPNAVTDEGALSLFSDIEEGDEVTMMVGSSDNLVQRAAWVADNALDMAHLGRDQIAGALVIYCAGCMLTVRDRMTEVSSGLARSLGNKPFLGNFTFGEQGCFVGGNNHHGNLMISVVVFGAKPR